jgi:chaperonin GroES
MNDKSFAKMESRSQLPKPLGTLVLIKEDSAAEKTAGGLYLPNISKETQFLSTGRIMAVGEGYYDNGTLIRPNVSVGDRVLFPRTSANVFADEKTRENWLFIATGSLLAVIPEKEV